MFLLLGVKYLREKKPTKSRYLNNSVYKILITLMTCKKRKERGKQKKVGEKKRKKKKMDSVTRTVRLIVILVCTGRRVEVTSDSKWRNYRL